MRQPKVMLTRTEKRYEYTGGLWKHKVDRKFFRDVLLTEGKLLMVPKSSKYQTEAVVNRGDMGGYVMPVIISETDSVEKGDWFLAFSSKEGHKIIQEAEEVTTGAVINRSSNAGWWSCFTHKILVLPDQFSQSQMDLIQGRQLNNNDLVMIECEEKSTKAHPIDETWYEVKLNEESFVNIYPFDDSDAEWDYVFELVENNIIVQTSFTQAEWVAIFKKYWKVKANPLRL